MSRPVKKLKVSESFADVLKDFPPNVQSSTASDAKSHLNDYGRSPMTFNSRDDTLVFQVIQLEEDRDEDNKGLIRLYGVTQGGSPLVVQAEGFNHYFYFPAPAQFTTEDLRPFRTHLNQLLGGNADIVRDVTLHKKRFMKSSASSKVFLKLTVQSPEQVKDLKDEFNFPRVVHLNLTISTHIFLKGRCQYRGLFDSPDSTYESDVPYVSRFMLDTNIVPMTWLQIEPARYTLSEEDPMQASASYQDIKILGAEESGDLPEMAALRALSIDIETLVPASLKVPHPKQEQVIQIACTVSRRYYSSVATSHGDHPEPPFYRCIFTLDTCAAIAGSDVFSFQSEKELLSSWRQFLLDMDPDVIMGHNILKFDIPFLLLRAEHLGLDDFGYLGRRKDLKSRYPVEFSEKIRPGEETFSPVIPGRLTIDLLHWARRHVKDPKVKGACKLETLAQEHLNSGKEGIHFTEMTKLQMGEGASAETRRELAVYCLKDAYLVQQVCDKLRCVEDFYVPTARGHCVPITWVTTQSPSLLQAMKKVCDAKGGYLVADVMRW